MKTWAKVGIGCLVVLVLACIISAAVFFFAGGWLKNKIRSATGDITQVGKSAAVIKKLDAEYPFTPPSNGQVSEQRLQAYIAVCNEAKPAVDEYGSWMTAHEGQKEGHFSDVKQAIELTGKATKALADGLKSHKMSPREFTWIEQTMDQASREAPSASMTEGQQQVIKVLQAQMNDPNTSEQDRQKLQAQIDKLEAGSGGQAAANESPNAALYQRYAEQLKACQLGHYGQMLLTGMAAQTFAR